MQVLLHPDLKDARNPEYRVVHINNRPVEIRLSAFVVRPAI